MLTKLDIAAMRKADRIVFRHKDGKSVIEAIKSAEKTEKDPFAQDVVIFVETAWSLDDYADGAEHTTYEAASEGKFIGFEMIYNYGAVWKTVASLLRPGDELTLLWRRDALSCGYLKNKQLHGDRLDLGVDRNGSRLTFRLEESICEDNTARMIRVSWASTRAATRDAA